MDDELLLRIEEDRDGSDRLVLRLRGEIDMSTAPLLKDRLEQARDQSKSVVLDLAELDFIDSSGLRLFIAARLGAQQDGWSVELINPGHNVRRLFEVSGLDGRLFFEPE
jgi:anti-sigma B factor antagonist